MKQTIGAIRDLLNKLEAEAKISDETAAIQALSGLELPDLMRDVVDFLIPNLIPYQAAIYLYLLRHSVLADGTTLVRVSRRGLQTGVIKSASGQSESVSYGKVRETLEALEAMGAICPMGEPNRDGTPYRVMLPEEIGVCQETRERLRSATQPTPVDQSELDFYNIRENRIKIYERDAYKCQHCGKQLTRFTVTLDHLVPVSQGGENTFENLLTACRECNSKKSGRPLGDFMADLNPT